MSHLISSASLWAPFRTGSWHELIKIMVRLDKQTNTPEAHCSVNRESGSVNLGNYLHSPVLLCSSQHFFNFSQSPLFDHRKSSQISLVRFNVKLVSLSLHCCLCVIRMCSWKVNIVQCSHIYNLISPPYRQHITRIVWVDENVKISFSKHFFPLVLCLLTVSFTCCVW